MGGAGSPPVDAGVAGESAATSHPVVASSASSLPAPVKVKTMPSATTGGWNPLDAVAVHATAPLDGLMPQMDVAPHTAYVAWLWAVLSRMRKPQIERYPSTLAEVIGKLSPLDNARYPSVRPQPVREFLLAHRGSR